MLDTRPGAEGGLGRQVFRSAGTPSEVGELGNTSADSVRRSPICPMQQDDPQSPQWAEEAMCGLPVGVLGQQGDEEAVETG